MTGSIATQPIALPDAERGAVADPSFGGIRRRRRMVALALTVLSLVALIVGVLVSGIRVFVVESPSMGRAAPVGSLVVGTTRIGELRVGDVVTYRPLGLGSQPYTHRVVGVVPGGVTVRGDINGAVDPWVVTPAMVESRTVAVLPGVGWAIRFAPYLLGGVVVAELLRLVLRRREWVLGIRMVCLALGFAVASILLRPFTGYVLLESSATTAATRLHLVSTALLPVRLTDGRRSVLDLLSGQAGWLTMPPGSGGRYTVWSQLHLDPLGWIVLAFVCMAPLILVLLLGFTRGTAPADA